jgi:hypothetical protein
VTPLSYELYLPLLIPLGAVAAWESVRARAGWASRVVLAALAVAAMYEAATVLVNVTDVSLSMISNRWPAFGVAFLVFIVSATVAIAEWLRRFGRWPSMGTAFAIAGGMLAWHICTELVG